MVEKPQDRLTLVISPKATRQWRRILEFYNRRNQSTDYSLKLDARLYRLLKSICQMPELGQKTRRKKIRRIVLEKFAIFYSFDEQHLEVKTIVDARRNVPLD